MEIIAHRGYSARAPENTLAALDAAVGAGADAVEFDIRTAGDGTPVLFHDKMLSRTTNGVGPLRRRTLGQLKGLDAGAWFSPEFAGESIPSLQEALEALAGRVRGIYAEVKGFREMEDINRMVRIVRDLELLGETVFIAMNWTLLDRMRSTEPDVAIGYIVDDVEVAGEALDRAAGDARALVDFEAGLLLDDPGLAEDAHAREIPTAVWTVDDVEDAGRLHETGVERITTNEVETLLDWKATL